jgi:hypothetical protein
MAVYDGVPSIRLEGDEGRALALIPEAKALLYSVQNFLRQADIGTFSMSRRIDDDSYIYVLSSNGQNLLHISVAPATVDEVAPAPEPVPPFETPLTLMSGMIVRGYLDTAPVAGGGPPQQRLGVFYPTPTCQLINDLPAGGQPSYRLAVSPHASLDELRNPSEPPVYSQYTKLRPSMYSGKMQQVVQAVMGLGRVSPGAIQAMAAGGVRRSYLDQLRQSGAQIQYDYKHQRTHGITTADDGRLWLVEISITRGVLAMPLPMYPGTSAELRALFASRDDDDLVAVIDALDGIPTGETFPRDSATLNARIARGDILRLQQPTGLSDFYTSSPYSTVLGWAFSPDGREAHNTGYYYHDDGYQRGVWWQINLRIGATNPDWVPGEGPLAEASASPRLMGEGFLYSERDVPPTNPRAYLPFKVHQPGFGLQSHSALPLGSQVAPRCDTVVHVCFINGDFHAVKFYRNPDSDNYDDIEDDRYPGECLYNGQWTVTERRGNRSFPPMMYSNREDQRQVALEYLSVNEIVSTDLGFGPPQYSDIILQLQYAHVFHTRYFKYVSTTTVRQEQTFVCPVAVPEFVREGYYMAYGEYVSSESTSTVVKYDGLIDPNQGYSWRCLGGFGEVGLIGVPAVNPLICGGNCSPFPNRPAVHPDRRVVYTFRNDYPCGDFADGGAWLSTCMSVEGFGPAPSYPSAVVTTTDPAPSSSGWLKLFMTGIGGERLMPFTYERAYEWTRPSPNPTTGEVHKISAYHNALGAEAICVMTDYLGYGTRLTEGYFVASITANDPIPCFIGVYEP